MIASPISFSVTLCVLCENLSVLCGEMSLYGRNARILASSWRGLKGLAT